MTSEWTPQFHSHRDLAFFKFVPYSMTGGGDEDGTMDSNTSHDDDDEDLIKSGIVMFSKKTPSKSYIDTVHPDEEDMYEAVEINVSPEREEEEDGPPDDIVGGTKPNTNTKTKKRNLSTKKHGTHKKSKRGPYKKGESVYAIPVAYFISVQSRQQHILPSELESESKPIFQYDYENEDDEIDHEELSSDIYDKMLSSVQVRNSQLEDQDYLQSKFDEVHLDNELRDDGLDDEDEDEDEAKTYMPSEDVDEDKDKDEENLYKAVSDEKDDEDDKNIDTTQIDKEKEDDDIYEEKEEEEDDEEEKKDSTLLSPNTNINIPTTISPTKKFTRRLTSDRDIDHIGGKKMKKKTRRSKKFVTKSSTTLKKKNPSTNIKKQTTKRKSITKSKSKSK